MKSSLAISVIVTVLNEAKTVEKLLDALNVQRLQPTELILTDGGSSDGTLAVVEQYKKNHPALKFSLRTAVVPGNRSRGRNAAIDMAKSELIAITDSGCIPAPEWLAELAAAYQEKQTSSSLTVIAGYATGRPQTLFQRAAIPYFLVMPDRIEPRSYLPATRSMLITKDAWKKAGKFPEQFNTSEDYIFANQLNAHGLPIVFTQKALVSWQPPTTLKQVAKTFSSFAACDIRAGIIRPKVLALFGRYILGALGVMLVAQAVSTAFALTLTIAVLALYLIWSVKKNLKYAQAGWYWLPVLQLTADFCVMSGSLIGGIQRVQDRLSSSA